MSIRDFPIDQRIRAALIMVNMSIPMPDRAELRDLLNDCKELIASQQKEIERLKATT